MRAILVLRGGALGDFLLTLPLLRGLRDRWPTARIELVGNAPAAALAVQNGILDAAHSQHESRWLALYSATSLPDSLREWLSAFDLVINLWPDPDGDIRGVFPLRAAQEVIHLSIRDDAGPVWSQLVVPLKVLGGATFGAGQERATLTVPVTAREEAARRITIPAPRIALHPGSGSRTKNAPAESWLRLLERLAPHPVLIVLGEAEGPQATLFRQRVGRRIQIADQWPLPVLAAALATCTAYVGHDTGISHLAAVMGTRGVLLFGPTDPAVWAPPGGRMHILRRNEREVALELEEVVTEVEKVMREHGHDGKQP